MRLHPSSQASSLRLKQRGDQPACVGVCPTRALTFGDKNDPNSEVAVLLRTRRWNVLKPNSGTDPNVFFLTPDGD